MDAPQPLSPDVLCTCCSADCFDFETTAELEQLQDVIGQERAVEAVAFGIAIRRQGYNIFALGPPGTGKSTTIERFLGREAAGRPTPDAWCYVHNFEEGHRPVALRLPRGEARLLRRDMNQLVEELLVALPAAFESDAYRTGREEEANRYTAQRDELLAGVREVAEEHGLRLLESADGLQVLPLHEGELMPPQVYQQLPEDEQERIRKAVEAVQDELRDTLRDLRKVDREARRALRRYDREIVRAELAGRVDELRERHGANEGVADFLDAVEADILDRPHELLGGGDDDESTGHLQHLDAAARAAERRRSERQLRRYAVNVLIDREDAEGAPVVLETNPTYANLVGRIEHEQRMGALVTDFTLIQPGALHRANGGFVVIEIEEILKHRHSWDGLKRALRNREVCIDMPGDTGSPMSTVSLSPAPIPLECKVVLIGQPVHYFTLHELDSEFAELFKVQAEFADSMPRTAATDQLYAQFVATVTQREDMLPFEAPAVAHVIDRSARLASDAQRLSTRFLEVTDLLRESDYLARRRGSERVVLADVQGAVDAQTRRADYARERLHERYARDIVLLETAGEEVGSINALTVVSRGQFAFGMPVRVTARARLGEGEVVDIEREVRLGGPLHSKGVLILSGFLGGHYLPDEPLSVIGSLTFEQSYGQVEGDSASAAELIALLSAISGLPIRQALAITGSVNQAGDIQPIGGVNEKIEGFFDICRQRGLAEGQGVLIPAANVQHLMLREDVVEAVSAGRFRIYPLRHVDEGIALLFGEPAGERGPDGAFPEGTVNAAVEARLRRLAERRREMLRGVG